MFHIQHRHAPSSFSSSTSRSKVARPYLNNTSGPGERRWSSHPGHDIASRFQLRCTVLTERQYICNRAERQVSSTCRTTKTPSALWVGSVSRDPVVPSGQQHSLPILNGKYQVPSQRRVLLACPYERTACPFNSASPSLPSLLNDKASSSCLIIEASLFDLNHNAPSSRSERHVSLSSQESRPPRHSGPFLWVGAILVLSVTSLSRILLAPARTGTPLVSCLRNDC